MYTDLRNWDAAKSYASKSKTINVTDLTRQQAEWSRDTADWKSAATMFSDSGDYEGAISLLIDHDGAEQLVALVRKLPKSEIIHLKRIADYFQSKGHHKFAKETYIKLGAIGELMKLLMANGDWETAMELAQNHPGKFNDNVFEPYAQYLAGEDRFEEAQAAYRRAGKPLMSIKLVASLAENAVSEGRFIDAARYNFELAQEHLAVAERQSETATSPSSHIQEAKNADTRASIYHAYNFIWQYTEEPFTTLDANTVFNASRYLLNVLGPLEGDPAGLSRVHIFYALAQTSEQLEAFKLARWAYDRLQSYKIPFGWRDAIDIAVIHLQAKPYSDKEDLIPVCTRCYASNPLVNISNAGDICVQCGQPFQRCFLTFHSLPLVEFKLPEGMSQEEGEKILDMDTPLEDDRLQSASSILRQGDAMDDKIDQWRASVAAGTNPHLGTSRRSKQVEDEFGRRCLRFETGKFMPVEVDEGILRAIPSEDIYVMECGGSQPARYFRNMVGDGVDIILNARRFFHGNDYEFCQLKGDHEPFVTSAM